MLKRYTAILLAALISLASGAAVTAQGPQEKFDQAAIDKIKEEGMKHSQVMDTLSYLTDVPGSRLTGSPGLKAAQDWARKKLAEWGLQNAHLEAWGPFGRGWSLEGFSASLTKPNYAPLIAYPKAWSPSTSGVLRAQPVYFDAKTEADLDKYKGKLKGAIVLLTEAREVKAHYEAPGHRQTDEELLRLANAEPPGAGGGQGGGRNFRMTDEQRAAAALQTKKWLMLQNEGAGLVLEPGRGDGGTMFVQSATLAYPQDVPREQQKTIRDKDAPPIVPQVVVAAEHYNRLIRMIQRGAPVQLEFNVSTRFYDQDLMSANVVAEIPGTDLKDEIVMLGAHFDSWHSGTGATDNAAGSAVCMEAVRILQSLGLKPRRTIRIGLWSGEEQGLLGSRAYVSEHFAKRLGPDPRFGGGPPAAGATPEPQTPPQFEMKAEHEKFAGYFNLDNGTGKVRGIYMQGNEEVRPIFRAWFGPFRDMIGAGPAPEPRAGNQRDLPIATLSISNTGGTDHQSFDGVGLPGFQFIQDPIEYDTRTHHSNMDVYDRIQEDDMKQAATIMAAFVYNTAMRDKKLPRKPLPGQPVARTGQ
ncbi:MAG TPA: M20/M25/M40 family metallo-hydrolase [Blastocatellia bacterium]|nr:M20/M25/M40 family metallo-hydrolase [Blastocatellia bacterium]